MNLLQRVSELLFSVPQHGEPIEIDGRSTRQFQEFMDDMAELYDVSSKPDEAERIFNNGMASLNLITFLQEIAEATGFTAPLEGEVVEDGIATFRFQDFLDDIAGN